MTYDNEDILSQVVDGNGNDIKDLDDLEKVKLDGLLLQDLNTDHEFTMTVRFEPALTISEHQGDSVETTLTVTLNQHSSQ